MPTEHIKYDDVLRKGTDKLNKAIDQANKAEVDSEEALTTANQALQNSESTQTQLDTIVIEGDSSVEAAQARVNADGSITYTTLKERLDTEYTEVTAQLADTPSSSGRPPGHSVWTEFEDRAINVKWFGAIGDGLTDNTQIFNDIIQSGHKKLWIPYGTFIVGDLNIPDDMIIEGVGTLQKLSTANGIFSITGKNVIIKGLSFNSFDYLYQSGYLISVSGSNTKILDCKFNVDTNSKEYAGISLGGTSKNTTIQGNHLQSCAFMIRAIEGASDITINNNYFTGGTTKGVVDTDGNYTTEPVGDAIKLTKGLGGNYVNVINNVFEDIYRDCIDLFTCGVMVNFSYNICKNTNVLVADIKTIYRDPDDPYGTTDPANPTRDIILSFNVIKESGTLGQSDSTAISIIHTDETANLTYSDIQYSAQRVKIFGNKIHSSSKYGIYILKCKNIEVANNEIKDVIERYVYLRNGCEDIDVTNNDIYLKEGIDTLYGVVTTTVNAKRIRIKENRFFSKDNTPTFLYGVFLQGGKECEVKNNSIYTVNVGIHANSIENSVIENNTCSNCNTAGIRIGQYGIIKRSTIKSNVLMNSTRDIMFTNANEKLIFADNVSINCPTTWSGSEALVNSVDRNNDVITS